MQKRIRVTLDTGLTQDHVLDFKDDDEFLQWASEVMTNLTKFTAGWFILDGPYAWYRVEHIVSLIFVDAPPPDPERPIGFIQRSG